jgi:hypothetical protein
MTRNRWVVAFLFIAVAFVAAGCRKSGENVPTSDEEAAAEEAFPEEAEPAAKPAPPKVTEEVYIDLTVQSVVIRERLKDDPAAAEQEVEALFEKTGVTIAEYKEFASKLSPEKMNDLQKKIQEKLQPFIK